MEKIKKKERDCLAFYFPATKKSLAGNVKKYLKSLPFSHKFLLSELKLKKIPNKKSPLYPIWKKGGVYKATYEDQVVEKKWVLSISSKEKISKEELEKMKEAVSNMAGENLLAISTSVKISDRIVNFKEKNPVVIVYHLPKNIKPEARDLIFKKELRKIGFKIVDDGFKKREKRYVLLAGKMMTSEDERVIAPLLKKISAASNYKRVKTVIVKKYMSILKNENTIISIILCFLCLV